MVLFAAALILQDVFSTARFAIKTKHSAIY